MRQRFLKRLAFQTSSQSDVDIDPWVEDWPAGQVLFEAGTPDTAFRLDIPEPTHGLATYLSHVVVGKDIGAEVVAKLADKVGPWVREVGSTVTASLLDDAGDEYMTLVVTDGPCHRAVRLWLQFHTDPVG